MSKEWVFTSATSANIGVSGPTSMTSESEWRSSLAVCSKIRYKLRCKEGTGCKELWGFEDSSREKYG